MVAVCHRRLLTRVQELIKHCIKPTSSPPCPASETKSNIEFTLLAGSPRILYIGRAMIPSMQYYRPFPDRAIFFVPIRTKQCFPVEETNMIVVRGAESLTLAKLCKVSHENKSTHFIFAILLADVILGHQVGAFVLILSWLQDLLNSVASGAHVCKHEYA